MQGAEGTSRRVRAHVSAPACVVWALLVAPTALGCAETAELADTGMGALDSSIDGGTDAPARETLHTACSDDEPCSPGEQCVYDRHGDWWCLEVGLAPLDYACNASQTTMETWLICEEGLFCDVTLHHPENPQPVVCRPPCMDNDDCVAGERCVDAAVPGPLGLCRASECDYDGNTTTPIGHACLAWEFLGGGQAFQDIAVQVSGGASCAEAGAFCGEGGRLGVCGADLVCRASCRSPSDCPDTAPCDPATVNAFELESFDLFSGYSSADLMLSVCGDAS